MMFTCDEEFHSNCAWDVTAKISQIEAQATAAAQPAQEAPASASSATTTTTTTTAATESANGEQTPEAETKKEEVCSRYVLDHRKITGFPFFFFFSFFFYMTWQLCDPDA